MPGFGRRLSLPESIRLFRAMQVPRDGLKRGNFGKKMSIPSKIPHFYVALTIFGAQIHVCFTAMTQDVFVSNYSGHGQQHLLTEFLGSQYLSTIPFSPQGAVGSTFYLARPAIA